MSINRKLIKTEFMKYVAAYDASDERISLKIKHTYKVAQNSDRISESLGVLRNDKDMAWAIAMLHDIGRFEQARQYGTFIDAQSIDHGRLGADILFNDGIIDRFGGQEMTEDEKKVIEIAIRQHNKYRITDGLPEGCELDKRQTLFCNIIRDADKIDIFRAVLESSMETIYGVSEAEMRKSDITPEVRELFEAGKCVERSLRKTPMDLYVGHVSLVFELVFPASRRIAVQQGYIKKMLEFESENPEVQKVLDAFSIDRILN